MRREKIEKEQHRLKVLRTEQEREDRTRREVEEKRKAEEERQALELTIEMFKEKLTIYLNGRLGDEQAELDESMDIRKKLESGTNEVRSLRSALQKIKKDLERKNQYAEDMIDRASE
mmetsp:Transcript_25299/g.74412  ORF Transcript_25299/g.74412 Transcript_25299/m.74412 type:complete len:117 (+) Transcript_25299:2186-2536(+)